MINLTCELGSLTTCRGIPHALDHLGFVRMLACTHRIDGFEGGGFSDVHHRDASRKRALLVGVCAS